MRWDIVQIYERKRWRIVWRDILQRKQAGVFGVGKDTLNRWMKQYRETDTLSPKPLNRTFKKIDPMKRKDFVKEHLDAILKEMAEQFR